MLLCACCGALTFQLARVLHSDGSIQLWRENHSQQDPLLFMIYKDLFLHPRRTSGTKSVQEQERPNESPWVGEAMEIFLYFLFCWSSSYYPVLLSVPQGKHVSKCQKWAKENTMDDNKKFLGRKDKGKKLLQDVVCTVGTEVMKESGSWRRTSWEKRSGEV